MHPGKKIQQYTLIEQVGQGGQAAVWSAEDELLKRTVAIKTINLKESIADPNMGSVDQQAQRFVTEARTIADLEHPYILPIYTYGQEGDWLYIVMRYMAGGTLRKVIGATGLSLDEALKLAAPLADALDQAHQKQIVHRDIKSVNVLLDAQRRPYLADFGLSVTVGDPSSQSGSGTLAYMSPEQLRGDMADHRSDLYSFAMLVYEMLTGHTPEWNGAHWNLGQLMSGVELPIPEKISSAVAVVLKRGVALKPADRYPSATAMVEALRQIDAGNRVGAVETIDLGGGEGIFLTLDGFDAVSNDITLRGNDPFNLELLPINDPALMALNKANALFDTALNEWADGAGRFRLYADDYKFIDSFYGSTDMQGLELSDASNRMMLRAALEHGYKVDFWWQQVTGTADRRAVTLQTLTSELPLARLRAIEYLTLQEDSDPPAIPIRVATIISRDADADVRMAGVLLLEERASSAQDWRQYAYNAVIDEVLAEIAIADLDIRVQREAAHAIGRLRASEAALSVAKRANEDVRALQSLTDIREEAPTFPPGIDPAVKRRAFTRLSLRQMVGNPRQLLIRYFTALLGAALGLGTFVYSTLAVQGTSALGLNVLINAVLNVGVTYGAFFAVGVLIAVEPARRLRAWNKPSRIVLSAAFGALVTMGVFYLFRSTYNNIIDPFDNPVLFFGPAALFPIGFALGAALTENIGLRTLAAWAVMAVALLINWAAFTGGATQDYLFYLDPTNGLRSLAYTLWIGFVVSSLAYLPEWTSVLRARLNRIRL
jgi:serine/threonine protein kinase